MKNLTFWVLILALLILLSVALKAEESKPPPNLKDAHSCQCQLFKWQHTQTKEIAWTTAGRVNYHNRKAWVVTIEIYRKEEPTEKMVREACFQWFIFVRHYYHQTTGILRVENH